MTDSVKIPKTVLMTADPIGGVWTYSLDLARGLSKNGIRTALAVMGAPLSSAQRLEAKSVDGLTLYNKGFKLEWMEEPWEDVSASGRWLKDIEHIEKPDIVHLNGYGHATLGWQAPTLVVAHSCVLSWWKAVKGTSLPGRWREYREAVEAGLASADMVVAPTNAMLATLYENYSFSSPCRVIPNSADLSGFGPGVKEDFIFTAGRLWDEAKNFSSLFSIAGGLGWPLYAAGEAQGPFKAGFENTGAKLLGKLSKQELSGWLSRAGIFALPALYEPFGLAVLEAGLSGCALVLGDIPSLRENWDDAALFVDPKDGEALENALNSLASDHALRGDLAARARSRALEFDAEVTTQGYISAYSALLDRRSPGRAWRAKESACGY